MKISMPFKTIFMRYYLTAENHKMFHCWLTSTSKLTQLIIRKVSMGSTYGKHILTSDNCSSQHNTQPHSLMKPPLHLKEYQLSDAKGDEWSPEGNQQRRVGTAGSNTDESADDKQSSINALSACCKKDSVSKKDQDHLRSYERGVFLKPTF